MKGAPARLWSARILRLFRCINRRGRRSWRMLRTAPERQRAPIGWDDDSPRSRGTQGAHEAPVTLRLILATGGMGTSTSGVQASRQALHTESAGQRSVLYIERSADLKKSGPGTS